ncbi:hypothetical protein M9H77_05379 [Catharanthus roseus]|uniref:Uncharacterized protein n=1 Tax=Catharanthus roseus TaxID=4058 RepID=A0ACC0CGY5_CATRO|nr:hypothetical protein M9H77_05379 [Catharanthus roseus]
MVSIFKEVIRATRPFSIPIEKSCGSSTGLLKTFIPFSQLQEIKLLEQKINSILDSCISVTQLKQVHAQIVRKGLDQCCFVLAKLVRMLTKFEVPMDPYPRNILSQVHFANPFMYTSLIRGYLIQGSFEKSVSLYGEMWREGISPVSFTITAFFKACGAELNVDLGRQFHGQIMKFGGFTQDIYVGNTLIDMYVKCGWLDCGRQVFDEMPERDLISWTTLIVAYAKRGNMLAAVELFDRLPVKDMVACTAMVTGFAQNGQPREALEYFEKMQSMGVDTDEVTLAGVISACAQLGAAKYASWIRDVAEKSGFGPADSVVVGSALIDMYSKCGSVEEAYNVFIIMRVRNVFSYSSMILGFAIHGCAKEAIALFEEMLKTDVKPNAVTFLAVLTACSHAGFVEQGQQFFEMMEKRSCCAPQEDHYACLVDLLGRAGRFEDALELIKTMPMKSNGGVWGALLGACRIHVNPDVAEIAAGHLFELDPNHVGNYVLLSIIYASAGRWKDVSRIRKLIRTKGLIKNPACSLVEGEKGVIHEFYSDDLTHPKSAEIREELQGLLHKLKLQGYQPLLSSAPYDVSDEDKKRILMAHSEKLALGYMLLTTDAGSVIRIIKNLRTCEDCHSFMCAASQVTGREIIIRDNMRFHHFQNGTCSCNNFW